MTTHNRPTDNGLRLWTPSGYRPFEELIAALLTHRGAGRTIITTNGCFDLLHPGHVRLLAQARALGDVLVVGLNSDTSVRQLKGPARPLTPEHGRAEVLAALRSVDYVLVFDDLQPSRWLEVLRPDVHCKGGDYDPAALPEAAVVSRHGGRVQVLPFVEGFSTSGLVRRIEAGG